MNNLHTLNLRSLAKQFSRHEPCRYHGNMSSLLFSVEWFSTYFNFCNGSHCCRSSKFFGIHFINLFSFISFYRQTRPCTWVKVFIFFNHIELNKILLFSYFLVPNVCFKEELSKLVFQNLDHKISKIVLTWIKKKYNNVLSFYLFLAFKKIKEYIPLSASLKGQCHENFIWTETVGV